MKHGAISHLKTGRWPAHAREMGLPQELEHLREQLTEAVQCFHGEVSIKNAALIQSAERHEGACRLFLLYLEENPSLPIEIRLSILKSLGQATDRRDSSIKALNLEVKTEIEEKPFAFLVPAEESRT